MKGSQEIKSTHFKYFWQNTSTLYSMHTLQYDSGVLSTLFTLWLTISINCKRCLLCNNLIVADLAVLWRAVLIPGLHLQDAVIDLALGYSGTIQRLPEHRRELIYIIHLDMNHSPAIETGGETEDNRSGWGTEDMLIV